MEMFRDKVLLANEFETECFGRDFSKILKNRDVVLFFGDLGAGKSVLCRSIIRALCQDTELEIPSPTYTLVQSYDGPTGTISHFDLYRINDPQEIYEIGWEDALDQGICLIEWPERLGSLLPPVRIDVRLDLVPDHPNHRKVSVKRYGPK